MAYTRLSKSAYNAVLATATVLKNGTGGGAPALTETASNPMANLQTVDRFTVWASGASAPDPLYVHYDLGSDLSIVAVGYHAMRVAAGASLPSSVVVGSRTAAGGYSGTPGDYTTRATLSAGLDVESEITPASARYWQFTINGIPGAAGCTLGKLALITQLDNLGLVHSPGGQVTITQPQARTRTPGGVLASTVFGNPYRSYSLPFLAVPAATKATLEAYGTQGTPFIYIDQDGLAFECLPSPDFVRVLRWSPADLFDVVLNFEALA